MDKIYKEFRSSAIVMKGILLLNAETAILVIQRCKELNLKILGIDTFIVDNKGAQPFFENRSDYSKIDEDINVWEIAEDFILEKRI